MRLPALLVCLHLLMTASLVCAQSAPAPSSSEIQVRQQQSSSLSANKQFTVHGADLTIRSAFCILCEETSASLGRLLKDEGKFTIPVVIVLKTPPDVVPTEPAAKPNISLLTHGGFHLQVTAQLRSDFRTEDFVRELVRVLLAERIVRNHKDVNTERERSILPEWLLTGVMQAMEFRSRSRPSVLFAAVFRSGQVYSIDRILDADPKNLDALARGVYEVSSCALVLTLLDQPDGPVRVAKFLHALAMETLPDRELLQQHFPTLGASKNSLEKWWTLQMASLATPSAFETMTVSETEEHLDKALTLHFTEKIGEEPSDLNLSNDGKRTLFGWLKREGKGSTKTPDAKPGPDAGPLTLPGPPTPTSTPPPLGPDALPPLPGAGSTPGMSTLPGLPGGLPGLPAGLPGLPGLPPAPAPAPTATTPAPEPAAPVPGTEPATPAPEKKADMPPAASAPAAGSAPGPDSAKETPKPEPEKKGTTPDVKPKPAPKPKPKSTTPPAAAPAAAPKTTPAAKDEKDKEKPGEAKKEEPAKEEDTKPRFRFPKIFGGGKSVVYPLMLFAAVAVVDAVLAPPPAPAAEDSKPKTKAEAKKKEEAKPAAAPAAAPEPEPAKPSFFSRKKRANKPEDAPPAVPAATPPMAAPPKPPVEKPVTKEAPPVAPKDDAEDGTPKKTNLFKNLFKKKEPEPEVKEDAPASEPVKEKPVVRRRESPPKTPKSETAAPDAPVPGVPPSPPAVAESQPKRTSTTRKPGQVPLEDYLRIWKRPDRDDILRRNLNQLNAINLRAHPLYKPLVEEYTLIVQQLLNGKEKGAAEKLEKLRQMRMQIQGRAKAVESYVDWYEASETQNYSHLFDDYLKLRDRMEKERTPRTDIMSKYLDEIEKEYE